MIEPYKLWMFSAGEIGVQLGLADMPEDKNQIITLGLHNADPRDILRVVMTVNAYREAGYRRLALFMPYVPYGRQDRVTAPRTAFSLKAFAQIINNLDFVSVAIVDPHSPVTTDYLERAHVFTQAEILAKHLAHFNNPREGERSLFIEQLNAHPRSEWVVIAPDKGAIARAEATAEALFIPTVLYAEKQRNPQTGEIVGLTLSGEVAGRHVLVVDDICDGGFTFIKLAEHLTEAASRTLFVSHGIFSKGYATVAEHYDGVFCFDTFDRSIVELPEGEIDEVPDECLIHFSVIPNPAIDDETIYESPAPSTETPAAGDAVIDLDAP